MAFKIGFNASSCDPKPAQSTCTLPPEQAAPRPCVVQVHFPARNMTLAYYNDRFLLSPGDFVYVDGKLEGLRGRVTEVNYNFKIKLSDYKRIIARVDTEVHGEFFFTGSHFVCFDADVLPYEKALLWFTPPKDTEDGDVVSGQDDTAFPLHDLKTMNINPTVAQRGYDYYMDNKVRYLCLDGTHGRAIVAGSHIYEVEFEYRNGQISGLVCSCFCSGNCKHEFAALLQLRETLDYIEASYADQYERTGYFAAILKGSLFTFAIDSKHHGRFML